MNVLYIHNDYGRPSGEEHAAESIAQLLAENGHAVAWFRRTSAELEGSTLGKVKAFFSGMYNPASAAALDERLRSHKPDIVQVQNIYPLISPSIFAVLNRWQVPVVMRCPNYRLFCPNGRHLVRGQVCERCLRAGREIWCVLKNCEDSAFKSTGYALRNAVARIRGSILRGVDVFMVQSVFQKNKFVQNGIPPERVEILPGMVRLPKGPDQVPLGDLVTFVGRVSAEKGIEEFIDAARLLPDIPFAVAGDDHWMPSVRASSPSNVTWHGFLGGEQLRRLYVRSRVVVVPSRWYEGFPNVLLQAMALGKPTVCSAIGGLPEIIGNGTAGLLSPPGDARALARRIRTLYDDPTLCRLLGEAAGERARREYSPEACYTRLMKAFRKAVDLRADKAAVRSSPWRAARPAIGPDRGN